MAEVYNTDRFAELYNASQAPPIDNLGLAAGYVAVLLEANNIPTAFLGGWALYLRGSGRSTNDVDLTVQCTMNHLMNVLRQQPPLSIPQQHGATSVQIFVHTGGQWNAGYTATPISVDIIISGNLGAPANLPHGTEVIVPVNPTTEGTDAVRVIDLRHQIAAKLSAYSSRGSENDYNDLNFLIATNVDALFTFSHRLDIQQRRLFAEAYASRNSSEPSWIDYIRQVLKL